MIDENRIHNRYMSLPLSELQSRSTQLDAAREHIGKGQMPHGMSVYRRRLIKALAIKESEQKLQQEHQLEGQNTLRMHLSPQQRHDKGYQSGRQDMLRGRESAEWDLDDDKERQGYRDGFRSVQQRPSQPSWSSWGW
ncbi:MAG TPA: hypothetical protein DEB30_00550 [Candidatus Peribacter riflensis]|uniref:Uncharacterized protein n=1 Tax=Candidatus Peribacter riflensis TaxID=1735162 RepID=A0A0S1SQ08_9BACT|nr:MAG: hypothetical protein PeribacterA2_0313 [Candidatus Peribacter riflensis]OGJ78278.1 MAG: hypothetical protein A2398_05325 [Candidatus Peribacteria bacterium RIFOXYB1_FULL_57_12]OGJ81813.1 MAG: hypothetical protein A2412_00950 [Candidatus Peribacteria bacterium RIFOXYC1_FULL_58_8]ALM10806.1 MAG: hypothetical protein PeribacterB2_0313 [Candidatus Peribacter riflensis]ALM11908.1 MAG: hypothetical protein PeribacterC2_0312 [Candidatus Peribacter riflensis]